MNPLSTPINDFIKAFELKHPTKGVCFDASVYVYTDKLLAIVESEVHITSVSGINMYIVQLLNPKLTMKEIPDMFESGRDEFSFQPDYGLVIKGKTSEYGDYKVLVQPANKDCKDATFAEIHAKTNN